MENKIKRTIGEYYDIYDIYLFVMAITVNLFLLVFVHNKYDLSPNLALLVATSPMIIIQGIKIINMIMDKK
jgi:hypothetical protein